jgi:hypothetical protein
MNTISHINLTSHQPYRLHVFRSTTLFAKFPAKQTNSSSNLTTTPPIIRTRPRFSSNTNSRRNPTFSYTQRINSRNPVTKQTRTTSNNRLLTHRSIHRRSFISSQTLNSKPTITKVVTKVGI